MGGVSNAGEAAAKIARQVNEAVFADVMAARDADG